MSTSDAATAVMTKKSRIFVCSDFTVKSIRYMYLLSVNMTVILNLPEEERNNENPILYRCGFFEKTSCIQFSVCASLHDLDYLRRVETEPTKVLMLDSDHKIWCWEPTKRGSVPYIMPGLAKLNGTTIVLLQSLYEASVLSK